MQISSFSRACSLASSGPPRPVATGKLSVRDLSGNQVVTASNLDEISLEIKMRWGSRGVVVTGLHEQGAGGVAHRDDAAGLLVTLLVFAVLCETAAATRRQHRHSRGDHQHQHQHQHQQQYQAAGAAAARASGGGAMCSRGSRGSRIAPAVARGRGSFHNNTNQKENQICRTRRRHILPPIHIQTRRLERASSSTTPRTWFTYRQDHRCSSKVSPVAAGPTARAGGEAAVSRSSVREREPRAAASSGRERQRYPWRSRSGERCYSSEWERVAVA